MDHLESRSLMSVTPMVARPTFSVGFAAPDAGPGAGSLTPSQVQQAYQFSSISFNGTPGTGNGETIAIVDAYDDPKIQSDLNTFDTQFGLPATTVVRVNQTGGASYPASDSTGGWELEESLDVEWAHAIAPKATIMLVEANSAQDSDLLAAVGYAAAHANVVSMSWGGGEFSGQTSYDSTFSHAGVVFVASSGDSGAPISWPAASPNVLSVGGTALTLGSGNVWSSETGWSGSTGGPSAYESQPSYQSGVVTQTTTKRANPDVAYDASPSTGVAVYDSVAYSGKTYGWLQVGGTSAGAPQWAALIAIADQGRALASQPAINSTNPQEVMTTLYKNPADFHDIKTGTSTGSPNYSAGPGYDYVTGLGSPIANLIVTSLDGPSSGSPDTLALAASSTSETAGAAFSVTVTASKSGGSKDASYLGTIHFTSSDAQAGLPANYTFTVADGGSHTFSVTLKTAGSQSITATDTMNSATTSTLTGLSVKPAAASVLGFSGLPATATAGTSQSFTVRALDPYGNVATGYTGTVHFTSSDISATLPANYTFTIADAGVHAFSVTFKTVGTQSLTVTDIASGGITATQSGIGVAPAAPTSLVATAASSTQINLVWSSSAGATGYQIQQSSTGTSGWTQVGSTTGANSTTFQQSGLAAGTTYFFRVLAVNGSVSSAASNVASATTTGTAASPVSIWSNSYVPSENAYSSGSYEVGVKFTASVGGTATGIRFFKQTWMNGYTHVGHLWSSAGTLLATVTFSNESASGWQQVNFASPVAIQANTVYIASFSTGGGYFGISTSFFNSSGVTNGPLQALANTVAGGDGVYGSAGTFPTVSGNGMNFWADVAFSPGSAVLTGKGKGTANAQIGGGGSGGGIAGQSGLFLSAVPIQLPAGQSRFVSGPKGPLIAVLGTLSFRRVVPQLRAAASWRSTPGSTLGSLQG